MDITILFFKNLFHRRCHVIHETIGWFILVLMKLRTIRRYEPNKSDEIFFIKEKEEKECSSGFQRFVWLGIWKIIESDAQGRVKD
jgi:hypothetical protein